MSHLTPTSSSSAAKCSSAPNPSYPTTETTHALHDIKSEFTLVWFKCKIKAPLQSRALLNTHPCPVAAIKHPASPDPFMCQPLGCVQSARPERAETLSSLCFFEKGKYFPTLKHATLIPKPNNTRLEPMTSWHLCYRCYSTRHIQIVPFFTGKILTTPHSRAKNTHASCTILVADQPIICTFQQIKNHHIFNKPRKPPIFKSFQTP